METKPIMAADTTRKRRKGVIRRFGADKRGSVAIEFVMLIMPFTLLVFAIIETCISFAGQQIMANITDDLARSLRTGQLRAAEATPVEVRRLICEQIQVLVTSGCPGLLVDLKEYATFSAVPTAIPYTAAGDINTAGFAITPGGASTINSLRVFYRWPIMTDLMRGKLSTLPDGKTLLYSTMTWRNEPFLT
jgi:Flp pilus assembly protein TadG